MNRSNGTQAVQQQQQGEQRAGSLSHALTVLRRRLWIVIAAVLVVAGAALGFSLLQTKQYSATATLLFRDPGFDQRLFGSEAFTTTDPTREAATNLNLVSLEAVADLTARNLPGGRDGDSVASDVEVQAEGASNLVSITATDPDPEFAALVANRFAVTYVRFRRDADRSKIEEAIRLVEREYDALPPEERSSEEGETLNKQVGRLQALSALQTGNAEIVQRAETPSEASVPKTERNVIVGVLAGLVLGLALAFLLERFDRRLRGASDLEEAFGLPLLSSVPESGALFVGTAAPAEEVPLPLAEAEAFRMMRTRLRYFNVDRDVKVVLSTSAAPDDGKSTVSWNLAGVDAQSGARALLLEADFRRPTAARRHGLAPAPGLAELLTHQAELEAVVQRVRVSADSVTAAGAGSLDVITSGSPPPSPAELLGSVEMSRVLDRLRAEYDLIVIDAPPILAIADPIPLTRLVDGVVIVARLNKTTMDEARNVKRQLDNLGAPVLGVIANRVRESSTYSYGYYYANGGHPRVPQA